MTKFKEKLPYYWVYYVLVVVLSVALWVITFNLFHAPQEFESLDVFFAGTISDYQIETNAQEHLAENGVKVVEFYSSSPADNVFETKYNVVGLNGCDICIVPLSIAQSTQCSITFLELGDTFGCQSFVQEDVVYGVIIPQQAKTALSSYFAFTSEDYVVMINAGSINSGGEDSLTDNAQLFVSWLVNYV